MTDSIYQQLREHLAYLRLPAVSERLAPALEAAERDKPEIYVNPGTLPRMTNAETAIADTLALKNPDTVNNTNKKTIARRCVKYAKAARRSTNDCTSLPIFIQGNDSVGPAKNEIAALTRNPAWFALNHRVTSENTRWYRNKSEPAPGCPDSVGLKPTQASECDEFPFWSTLQAENGTLNGGSSRASDGCRVATTGVSPPFSSTFTMRSRQASQFPGRAATSLRKTCPTWPRSPPRRS